MRLLICFTFSCIFNLQHGTDGFDLSPNEVHKNRLPRNLLPFHYHLFVKPDLDGIQPPFPYTGRVQIHFTCKNTNKLLTLTSKDLQIKENSIKFAFPTEDSVPQFKSLRYVIEKHFIVIEVDKEFKKELNYSVSIEYSGVMKENSFGLYAARYRDVDNKIKYLAATQLEPIGFRRLTPGFDEVDMKATFDVVVARRPFHTSLSNTPLSNNHVGTDGWVHDSFETTPVMSPYPLCIVVGDLKYLEAVVDPGRKLKVRSYTTPALLKYMYHPNKYYTYPLQKWLEEEIQIPYPLQKIDHMTLLTFGGAMENWGLITYAEDIFPVSNITSSANGLFRSSFVISHELTHMYQEVIWDYLDDSWDEVKPNLSKMELVGTITRSWYTAKQLRDLKLFVGRRTNLSVSEQNTFSHYVLAVEQNKWFYKNNERSLGIWFGDQLERESEFSAQTALPSTDHIFTSPTEMMGSSLKSFKDKILDGKRKRMMF